MGSTLRSALAFSVVSGAMMLLSLYLASTMWQHPQGTHAGGNSFPAGPAEPQESRPSVWGRREVTKRGHTVALALVPRGRQRKLDQGQREVTWTGILRGASESRKNWHQS